MFHTWNGAYSGKFSHVWSSSLPGNQTKTERLRNDSPHSCRINQEISQSHQVLANLSKSLENIWWPHRERWNFRKLRVWIQDQAAITEQYVKAKKSSCDQKNKLQTSKLQLNRSFSSIEYLVIYIQCLLLPGRALGQANPDCSLFTFRNVPIQMKNKINVHHSI